MSTKKEQKGKKVALFIISMCCKTAGSTKFSKILYCNSLLKAFLTCIFFLSVFLSFGFFLCFFKDTVPHCVTVIVISDDKTVSN